MALQLSQFTHLIHLRNNTYALWNALWLRTIFLTEPFVSVLQNALQSEAYSIRDSDESFLMEQGLWAELCNALENDHFLKPTEDNEKVEELRNAMVQEKVSIMYLIMTQTCNLRCDYCFLTKMLENKRSLAPKVMSKDTIRKAVDYFKRILGENPHNPQIVLYGGEPTLSPNLGYALEYSKEQIPDVELVLVTNGTTVTVELANLLAKFDVNVGVSIDGPREIHNKNRILAGGGETFERAKEGHELLLKAGVRAGISCTITSETSINLANLFLWLFDDFGAKGIDFNILIGDSSKEYK